MMRFIDLSHEYWTDWTCGFPICAFLSTSDDRFIKDIHTGAMTFSAMDDIWDQPEGQRMSRLVPPGFFTDPIPCPADEECDSPFCPDCNPNMRQP